MRTALRTTGSVPRETKIYLSHKSPDVDTTIRNLDDEAYRAAKARAALEGRPVGEVVSEAIRAYVARPPPGRKRSVRTWKPEDFGKGTERLSEEIDEVLYGG